MVADALADALSDGLADVLADDEALGLDVVGSFESHAARAKTITAANARARILLIFISFSSSLI